MIEDLLFEQVPALKKGKKVSPIVLLSWFDLLLSYFVR
jgi:hypothetical protein